MTIVLPNQTRTKADPVLSADWYENDVVLKEAAEDLEAETATIPNSAYRTIFLSDQPFGQDASANTYILTSAALLQPIPSALELTLGSNYPTPYFYFDDADYTVSGKTQKLRLRAQVAVNATKAAIKFTFGLYPITVSGGADTMIVTLGTVVSGSTVEINQPAASTVTSGTGSDFAAPTDGAYALGVVTSAGMTNNSRALLSAQVQTRSV